MVKIKLSRSGVRKSPFYRIVVIDDRKQLRGKILEEAGYWFPKKEVLKIDKAVVEKWLKLGAKATPTVAKLLAK